MKAETDYAWAAGLLEGDGSFSLRVCRKEKRKGIQPVIQSSQLNPKPIFRLKEIAGTGIINNNDGFWRIQILGKEKLLRFLLGIYPHLSFKTEQCLILIETCEKQYPRGGRGYSDKNWEWFFLAKKRIEGLNKHKPKT